MPCRSECGAPSGDSYRKSETEKYIILLCSSCRKLEEFGFDFAQNHELDRFWDQHKKEDEKRRLAELREKEKFLLEEIRIKENMEKLKLILEKDFSKLTKEEKE